MENPRKLVMIKCENLSKNFIIPIKKPGLKENIKAFFFPSHKTIKAVKNFHLHLKEAGIIGLLGPNGSGKTTLMKMFTGLVVPTRGTLSVLGEDPLKRKISFRKNISLVMGQKSQLWWDIPAMDSFLLFQKYYEIEDTVFKSRVGELGERLGTTHLFHRPVRKLSLGERMKMELMASLLHNPKAIFLDEPTIGLDVSAQKSIRTFLKEYYQEKKPLILLTSHYMGDVEALCEKIIIIKEGEKLFEGSMEHFKEKFGERKAVVFHFQKPLTPFEKNQENSKLWTWSEEGLQVKIHGTEEEIKDLTIKMLSHYPVSDFYTENATMEDIMDRLISPLREPLKK